MTLRILSSFSFCGNFQLSFGSDYNVGVIYDLQCYNVIMLQCYNYKNKVGNDRLWDKSKTLCLVLKMLLLLTSLDDNRIAMAQERLHLWDI